MTPIDYELWEQYHFASFPTTAEWMAARSDAETTRTAWQRALSDVSLGDCRQATDSFLAGRDEPPRSPQDWPRFVRRVACELAASRPRENRKSIWFEGQKTVSCSTCLDDGLVRVWHPIAVKAAIDGRLMAPRVKKPTLAALESKIVPYSAAVACSCETGLKRLSLTRVRYDASQMPLWRDPDGEENRAELAKFLEERQRGQMW